MEEKIFCNNHLDEYANHYCEECKEFICPHCALSNNHFPHINKIKSLEEIIKQKIRVINDIKNFTLNKATELFQFILNYNSVNIPFEKSYILNIINKQIDEYIEKIVELKVKIKNIFSKKIELISNVLKSNKNCVLETQRKILSKINDKDNKNEYLNKLNLCLENIRQNKNSNDVIKFIDEYQNLIKDFFEDENDLNKKYNFFMAYKYLNEISLNFKEKTFEQVIQPIFQKIIEQIKELLKKLDDGQQREYEKFEKKLNELNIENRGLKEKNENKQINLLQKNNDKNSTKENNKKIEIKSIINSDKKENNIINKIKQFEEKEIKKKEENSKQIKKEEILNENQINENNNKDVKINENKNENEEAQKKTDKEKEKEDIKKKLENQIRKEQNQNNNNMNIVFEPPKIEGGKMTQEEIDNLKEDEEEKFLKKESEKEIGTFLLDSKMVEKTEIEIARNIIDELEDRLDIQYYEGVKFPDEEEQGELNDNAYLEDDEKKEMNIPKENNNKEEKEKKVEEKKIENNNNENKQKEFENKQKENENNINNNMVKDTLKKEIKKNEIEKNIKNNNLNALFGVNVKQKTNAKKEDETIKKNPPINLDSWVNIESVPKDENKDKIFEKTKRKTTTTSNPSNFMNLFGVNAPSKIKPKDMKKEKEIEKPKEIIKQKEIQKNENKVEPKQEIKDNKLIEEPKIPAPQNKESIEKIKKLNNLINSEGGRNSKEYKDLFSSLTWEEKNYIEIIGLKSSESKVYVYNQISDSIECMDSEIKFPSHHSYVNVPPYVYFSGGKVDNKPITLIRRLRKINNSFQIDNLGNLKEARSHHSSIYVKSINSLIIISGSKTKTCEKFNLTNKKIESFPAVKNAREKCGTCLINNEDLFIFFGYDKNKQKFETTVEKINIKNPKSWEVLLIIGDQNLLKRYSMACIPFNLTNFTNKKGIIITGGVGSLRNESDDTIFIDLEEKSVKKFNYMPFASSFTNPLFLPLPFGVEPNFIYNISNENKIISFNLENYGFSGTE